MKKEYSNPEITINRFSAENIVTDSGLLLNSATYNAALDGLTNNGDNSVSAENIFSFSVE